MGVRRAQDAADQHARHRQVRRRIARARSPSARRPGGSAGSRPICTGLRVLRDAVGHGVASSWLRQCWRQGRAGGAQMQAGPGACASRPAAREAGLAFRTQNGRRHACARLFGPLDRRGRGSHPRRSLRRRQGPVRGDRPAGSAALRPDQAGAHRRYQEDSRDFRHPRAGRRVHHRRRDLRRGDRRARGAAAGLARHRRGREPDRLDPDPGPRLARRQSVQRLAGRRQRAAADRRAGDLRDRRLRAAGARCRSRASSPARGAPR